ncbi:MAG TPA: MarR family transcriptional regulator [Thermoanaerobaculia bacterium]|nr:MarR family transcriptional regulator [Thermoanaerobaculia bacterium]
MRKPSPFKYERADDSAGFLLWKITALWQRELALVLSELGITQTQYAMLASLMWFEEQGEPATQVHLVEHAKIDKMTVSKAIRRLEEDGLVSRQRSSADSRATRVRFTAKGRRVIRKAVVAVESADERFFSSLSRQQLADFKRLTALVIAAI